MVLSAEKALADTKEQIKVLRRQARQAVTLEEQHSIQEKIQKLERQQRRQRQEIFTVADEIMEKRDSLIDQLERRLAQRTATEALFTIRWRVVCSACKETRTRNETSRYRENDGEGESEAVVVSNGVIR